MYLVEWIDGTTQEKGEGQLSLTRVEKYWKVFPTDSFDLLKNFHTVAEFERFVKSLGESPYWKNDSEKYILNNKKKLMKEIKEIKKSREYLEERELRRAVCRQLTQIFED
jgi:hypothetical protein